MAKSKKKKKTKKGLGLIKELTQMSNDAKMAEIVLLEDVPPEVIEQFGLIPSDVIDSIYFGISQGVFRAIVRFDIYQAWINQDGSKETNNQIMWAMWATDDSVDDQTIKNWKIHIEQPLRDYGTDFWVKFKDDNLTPDFDSISLSEKPQKSPLIFNK